MAVENRSSDGSERRIMKKEAVIIAIRAREEEKAPRLIHLFHCPIKTSML